MKEIDLSRRFIGAPCQRGHSGERYISSQSCCECARLNAIGMLEPLPGRVTRAVVRLVPPIPALTGRFVSGPWRACPIDMCPFCGTTVPDAMDRGRHIHVCRQSHPEGARS
jgi:hypothetical protein